MEKKHRNTARKSPCNFFSEALGFSPKQGRLALCRRRFALLFGLLICLPVAAQNKNEARPLPIAPQEKQPRQPDQPADERALPKTETPSPYLIESLLDINEAIDLKRIWQMLNLAPPAGSYRCEGNCEAETFDIATGDEDHKKTVALRISYENSHFYQYLIFRQASSDSPRQGEWQLLGNVDCFDQQAAPPAHRVEQGDGRTWLVIKASWKHESGTLAYGDVWYEIQESALKRVLSYPVEGHDGTCQRQPRRSYKAFLLRHDMDNGKYTIPIQFMIAYDMADCARPDAPLSLFAKGRKAYYVWDTRQGRFILDEARSEVTEQQIASFSGAQPFSHAAFVEDNFRELADLARSGDARRKAWLRDFLIGTPGTPRQADLQRLLQQ
jgi:hypothetical protein